MKKKVVTSGNKPIDKKVSYAVFNCNNRLIRKGMFTASEIQQYLNQKAHEGRNYYAIELQGLSRKLTVKELKPLENRLKKANLLAKDLVDLKALLNILKIKPAWEGMIKAYHFDTALREEIPLSIWKKMGGDTL